MAIINEILIELFTERTRKHIELVKQNAEIIADSFPEIITRVDLHDASKFKYPEFEPYVWLTEFYRCKQNKIPFEYPPGMKELVDQATLHHICNNEHHPEYWDPNKSTISMAQDRDDPNQPRVIDATRMPNIAIAEMVADWAAMSDELGTSLLEWANKTVDIRWNFSSKQICIIYDLIADILARKKNNG